MHHRQRLAFTTIDSEGALLPVDVLQRISQMDASVGGMRAEDYHCTGEKLNEVISDAWTALLRVWRAFQEARGHLPAEDSGERLTRERWLLPLFRKLDYGQLYPVQPLQIGEKPYPISHGWQHVPIHLVGLRTRLDEISRNPLTGYRFSPYSLVQELLNRSQDHLWGVVANGLRLRLLRKNASLTRQAYVEFDLEAMMQGECYADFVLFWLLCHQSRVEGERPGDCWLEKWSHLAQEQGVRVLDQLRDGVEAAINVLGRGFLAHPANQDLREKLRAGRLSGQDYYNQVLRLVYRLLILFVAEDRDVLFHPQADEVARKRYIDYYSTTRLRRMAGLRVGSRHSDLFYGLWLVMEQLGGDSPCMPLGLPALNGFLFSQQALPDLAGCELTNHDLLDAVRSLAFTDQGSMRRSVDYKNLGSEELGSIYESLLELHPEFNVESATFALTTASGNARKTTGSYYTPTSLIDCLLDSALMPVLKEASSKPNAEQAILALKVCDPACGSGHFLIAAAHRIAKELAAVRTGTEEPGPEERRAALRDVVSHCIYGVDINPMAVELCKVSLWMEAIEPGKPLSFLDAHIREGNSLLGATPALLRNGLPDEAFEPIEGDDKKVCAEFKKRNKQLRAGQQSLFREDREDALWEHQGALMNSMLQLEEMREDTVEDLHRKEAFFRDLVQSEVYENALLWANAWCAAFVWKKTAEMRPPITDEEFRDIGRNPHALPAWRKEEIERLARQYRFFHWHLAFPEVFRVPTGDESPENEQAGWSGGFDVVLGNPPWEHTALKELEWFATRDPEIANAAGAERKRKIEALATSDHVLYSEFLEAKRQQHGWSHFIRNSSRYPLSGQGRINTYAIFAENKRNIIGPQGRVGCIVPSGIATDATTKHFFQDLMDTRSLASLYDFENREGIFSEVHRSYKFCLLTLTGTEHPATQGANFAFFAQKVEDLYNEQYRFTLSASDIRLLNPNTRTCPVFRTTHDLKLTKSIYEHISVLIKEGSPVENLWNISLNIMFDMTAASKLFRTREQLENESWQLRGNIFHKNNETYFPLYEGKMISSYDHRFRTYNPITQEFEDVAEEQHHDPTQFSQPRYWIHQSNMPDAIKDGQKALIAYRRIARSTDIRTAIFSPGPLVLYGDTAPIILFNDQYAGKIACFAANVLSFIFDYVARQKVGGTHLDFFVLKQLPVLPPATYAARCPWERTCTLGEWIAPRALELTYTAWDLEAFARECGYAGPPFKWDEERRFLLRCELDAAYFHLYGIAREDVDYIMDTFRVWREKEEKQRGEFRTKRVILEIYDEMQRAIESGEAYRTRLTPGPADPAVAHALLS